MKLGGLGAPSDWIAQIGKVISSSLVTPPGSGPNRPVQISIEGIGSVDVTAGTISTADGEGEANEEGDLFGALGILGRPLPPTTDASQSEHAEVVCLRLADGLLPVAIRDVRLRMGGEAPGVGTTALVGYGGSFHSITPVDNDDLAKGAIQVIYCPYDFDSDGVPQKAHTITLDPTSGNESISLVHADGQSIFVQADGSVQLQSAESAPGVGQSVIQVKPNQINLQTDQLVLNGGMVVVGSPIGAILPLTPGVTSPPCPRLFVNPAP